jgi:hypothetical protein
MTEEKSIRATGGCLCGAVRYEVRGKLSAVWACHCSQCRRTTGHYLASTSTKREYFRLVREDGLRWYPSSDKARRGFCGICGSVLFWDGKGIDYMSLSAGSIDPPTGLKMAGHIFTADKSDYYEITDGLPQSPQWPERVTPP